MALVSATQMTLDFEPGLSERFDSLRECVRTSVYSSKDKLKTIAMNMDLSQSDLSRKLNDNPDDPRRFSVDDLERYLTSTGDLTPVYYLVEKYLQDEDAKQRRAFAELSKQLPEILALIKQFAHTAK